jgi:phosphatidylserine decarboxylase
MNTKWYLSAALASVFAASLASAQPPTGAWLGADQNALQQVRQSAGQGDSQTWLPVVQEFKALIENDPELYMLFTQMFEQIPRTTLYLNDPVGTTAGTAR